MHSPEGLHNTLLYQGYVLGVAPTVGGVGRSVYSKYWGWVGIGVGGRLMEGVGGAEEPLIFPV